MGEPLETRCENVRGEIKDLAEVVKSFMNDDWFQNEQAFANQHGEAKANIMLAYRHLEDARMRVGKIVQQIQGGVSKFDR